MFKINYKVEHSKKMEVNMISKAYLRTHKQKHDLIKPYINQLKAKQICPEVNGIEINRLHHKIFNLV